MILGLVLVTASMVGGAWALAAADRTVAYWATGTAVREGDPVRRSDFVVVRAKVPQRTARTLIRTNAALPDRLDRVVWSRSLGAGALIAQHDLAPGRRTVELPISMAAGTAPGNLRRGDLVDVWVTPGDRNAATLGKAVRLLSRARVVSLGGMDGAPVDTVVVDAGGGTVDGQLVAAAGSGRVTLVRVS